MYKQKEDFFRRMEELCLALTYNDVLLCSQFSEISPDEVDVSSHFSRRIELKIPLASSPMDTVTRAPMAIAMAEQGGIGVIDRNMSLSEQIKIVARVKNYLSACIQRPKYAHSHETVEHLLRRIEEKQWPFRTFPIVDNDNKVKGIVTSSDFDFCQDFSVQLGEIMSNDVTTCEEDTELHEAHTIMRKEKKKVLPVVDGDGRLLHMYTWKDVDRIVGNSSSGCTVDADGRLRVAAAISPRCEVEAAVQLVEQGVDALVLDSSHGNTADTVAALKVFRGEFPDIDLVAGNISQLDAATRLAKAGADAVRVGQGPGGICTTNLITGVGFPQVSAIWEAFSGIRQTISDCKIIADGGIEYSGDITTALAIGADSVMLGSLFAGCDETPGERIIHDGRTMKQYRGAGSLGAMMDGKGAADRYHQTSTTHTKLVPEGVEAAVPYRGPVAAVIFQLVGGLRSGMGLCGASTIQELSKKARFTRITNAGANAAHPHGVTMLVDAPNYSAPGE